MEGRVLAKRFGEAYYQVLDTGNALSAGNEDMKAMKVILAETDLDRVLASPNVSTPEKKELLKSQFDGKLHPTTLRLLELILEKRRGNVLPEIVDGIIELMDDRAGIVDAEARAAFELPQRLVDKLHGHLEKITGKKVRLNVYVEPALIGGITIRVGDAFLDGSFKTLLNQIQQDMQAARVA